MDNLENVIESVLFVSGEAVDINEMAALLDIKPKEIHDAVNVLKEKYSAPSGISLLEFNNKLQFATASEYSEQVALVLNPIRQRNLSKATLETAAIIAYKQPITRLEIEEIRGVSSDYAINILMEHNLITIVGRKDAVGKPTLFGTTDEFLKRFNISSIDDLPDYNELLERVKVVRENSESLYNHFKIENETDSEMEKKLGLSNVAVAEEMVDDSTNVDFDTDSYFV